MTVPIIQNKIKLIKWAIVLIFEVILLLVPGSELFTYQIRMFLLVTSLGILLVAFDLLNLMAVSMLFPIGYLALGLAPIDVVFSGWTQTLPMVLVGCFLISSVLDRIGLLKRMAYWCILKCGGSYYGLLFGIFIAGTVINMVTGGNGYVIMAVFTFGLCKAFDLGKSIDSAIIMTVGALAGTASTMFIYAPIWMNILLNAANSASGIKYTLTFLQFLWQMLPYTIFCLILILILPIIFRPKQKILGKDFYQAEYEKLGKMHREEKIATALVIFIILFLLTGQWHGIELDWGFVVLPWLMFLPGLQIATEEDIRKIDFSMVFFCVACLSIGILSTHLGLGQLIASLLLPVLQPLSSDIVIYAVYLFAVILNFLLTPFAILASFSEPIAQIAVSLGINPLGALWSMYIGVDQVFLPYEYIAYLIFYSFGFIKMSDFIKIYGLKSVLVSLLTFFVLIPWWNFVHVT